MRDFLKLGFTLFLIAAIAGLALGTTYEFTKDAIAYQEALRAGGILVPGATELKEIDEGILNEVLGSGQYPSVRNIRKGVAAGNTVGYQIDTAPMGYGGPIEVAVAIDMDGKVAGIKIGSHTETPGLGAKITEEKFTNQFVGLDLTTGVRVVKGTPGKGEVESVSGATISANAVALGVKEALEVFNGYLSLEPVAVTPVKEKGIAFHGDEPLSIDESRIAFKGAEFKNIDEERLSAIKEENKTLDSIKEAYIDGNLEGYVLVLNPKGFNGPVNTWVSLDKNGKVLMISIGNHSETPTVGDKIEEPSFLEKFIGLGSSQSAREVDNITGATGSADAVKDGVARALEIYRGHLGGGR